MIHQAQVLQVNMEFLLRRDPVKAGHQPGKRHEDRASARVKHHLAVLRKFFHPDPQPGELEEMVEPCQADTEGDVPAVQVQPDEARRGRGGDRDDAGGVPAVEGRA